MSIQKLPILIILLLSVPVSGQYVRPVVSAELESLNFMLGRWQVTGNANVGGTSAAITGVREISLALEGRWIEERFHGTMGEDFPIRARRWLTYNGESKRFKNYWIDMQLAEPFITDGVMDGDSLLLSGWVRWEASQLYMKTLISPQTDGSVVLEFSMGSEEDNLAPTIKETWVRISDE